MFQFVKNIFKRTDPTEPLTPTAMEERKLRSEYRRVRAQDLYAQGMDTWEISRQLGVARSRVYQYLGGIRNVNTGQNTTS